MLPGPTNVPNRVINAMLTPMINHRSDDFRKLYKDIVNKTQTVFETANDIVVLTTSGTGAVETSVLNLIKKDDAVIIPVNGEFSKRFVTEQKEGPFKFWKSTQEFNENQGNTHVRHSIEYELPTSGKIASFLSGEQANTKLEEGLQQAAQTVKQKLESVA